MQGVGIARTVARARALETLDIQIDVMTGEEENKGAT